MNILFVMLHPGYVRNYESLIRYLVNKGHHVHVGLNTVSKQSDDRQLEGLKNELGKDSFSFDKCPKPYGPYMRFARSVRVMQDIIRYFDPRYDTAPRLKERILSNERKRSWIIGALIKHMPKPRSNTDVLRWIRFLAHVENATPTSSRVTEYIRRNAPDVLLVTPIVNYGSDQVDFVKSAKLLNIPVGVCVASWDNLTNKGLIRVDADRIYVWNFAQRDEAIEMHGIAPDRIIVTGAQCYDKWFTQKPTTTREEFCNRVGLSSNQRILLYLCSSPFIGSHKEPAFVREWITAIRNSKDIQLAKVAILVRPHPQNATHWKDVDLSDLGDVAIFPREGANPVSASARAEFFDSMYYCSAVVGINTSAMIEAAIVNKPIFTIVSKEFRDTQEGTLHFYHLRNYELLHESSSIDEQLVQLQQLLDGANQDFAEKNRKFLAQFVRPLGMDCEATRVLGEEVLALRGTKALSRGVAQFWLELLLFILLVWPSSMLANTAVYLKKKTEKRKPVSDVMKRRRRAKKRGFLVRDLVGRTSISLIKRSRKISTKVLRKMAISTKWEIAKVRLATIPAVRQYFEKRPSKKVKAADLESQLYRELRAIASSKKMIVVGPWLSEVGFEVLYWTPFLTWFAEKFRIPRNRFVIISRGGAGIWCQNFADRFIDILDFMSPEEFREKNLLRWNSVGGQKQMLVGDLDREILDAVVSRLGLKEFELLHPRIMYQLFRPVWKGVYGGKYLRRYTRYQFDTIPLPPLEGLPREYIAVKFYFRPSLPDTVENRQFINSLLFSLAEHNEVVLLNNGFTIDDHNEFNSEVIERIHVIDRFVRPEDNLAIQTRVIANAKLFVGTYGGMSYLAPLVRTPSVTFYSNTEHFLETHLATARQVIKDSGIPFLVLDVKDKNLLNGLFGFGAMSLYSQHNKAAVRKVS